MLFILNGGKAFFYLIYFVFLCLKYLSCPATLNTLLPLKVLGRVGSENPCDRSQMKATFPFKKGLLPFISG